MLSLRTLIFMIFLIVGLVCFVLAGWLVGVATFNEGVKQSGLRDSLYVESAVIGATGLTLTILSLLKIREITPK